MLEEAQTRGATPEMNLAYRQLLNTTGGGDGDASVGIWGIGLFDLIMDQMMEQLGASNDN